MMSKDGDDKAGSGLSVRILRSADMVCLAVKSSEEEEEDSSNGGVIRRVGVMG